MFLDWYSRNRARSRALFDLIDDQAYYSTPIDLRHPIVFYEGHLSAFAFNTLVKRALGGSSVDPELERLFARGIDPPSQGGGSIPQGSAPHEAHDRSRARTVAVRHEWPDRREVRAFVAEADQRVRHALATRDLDRPGDPLLHRAEAVSTILEHEAMHQETLLYLWHRLPFDQKRRPSSYQPRVEGDVPVQEWIDIPPGRATLGAERDALRFGWDNERPHHAEDVGAFTIHRHNVTNADWLEFVAAGGSVPLFWELPNGTLTPLRVGAEWHGSFAWRGRDSRRCRRTRNTPPTSSTASTSS